MDIRISLLEGAASRNEQKIVTLRKAVLVQPEVLSYEPLDPVSLDGVSDSFAHRDAHPAKRQAVWPSKDHVMLRFECVLLFQKGLEICPLANPLPFGQKEFSHSLRRIPEKQKGSHVGDRPIHSAAFSLLRAFY